MIKCTNCGNECESGAFCPECGQKLERRCFSCGEVVPLNAKFCASCGTNLTGESPKTTGGDGNVIAGDVTGSYNTSYHTSVVNNNVYNQVIKEEDAFCEICGATIPASAKDLFQCKVCGKFFCSNHMDVYTHKCGDCEAKEQNAKFDRCKMELQRKMYDSALSSLQEAMNAPSSDPDVYYYAAIATLKGKRAFQQQKVDIDKAIAYLNEASKHQQKGIYHYLLAYIKYDYFEKKCFRVKPNYKEEFMLARQYGVSLSEIQEMYSLLSVERPPCL